MIRNKQIVFFTFIISVFFYNVSLSQSGTMLMPPYLQAVTTNSIYVLVESSSIDTVFVEYGLTPSVRSKGANGIVRYDHKRHIRSQREDWWTDSEHTLLLPGTAKTRGLRWFRIPDSSESWDTVPVCMDGRLPQRSPSSRQHLAADRRGKSGRFALRRRPLPQFKLFDVQRAVLQAHRAFLDRTGSVLQYGRQS